MPPLTKAKLVNLYKKENDSKVKERLLLLVIKEYEKMDKFLFVL